MLIFAAIAIAAFIVVTGSFFFGGDHDADHDTGDAGPDMDGDVGEPTISIFSPKCIGTLLMGFGSAGAIARYYGLGNLGASAVGLVSGLVLGGAMFGLLTLFYKQQSSSLVATPSTIGCAAMVAVTIGKGSMGEVSLCVDGQYLTYSASAQDGQEIPKGQTVRVVETRGSHLIVEKAS
jgi:membrane protein implicated in regulation of membrane protease activity